MRLLGADVHRPLPSVTERTPVLHQSTLVCTYSQFSQGPERVEHTDRQCRQLLVECQVAVVAIGGWGETAVIDARWDVAGSHLRV